MLPGDKEWKRVGIIFGVLTAGILLVESGRETFLYLDQGKACRMQVQDLAITVSANQQEIQNEKQSIAVMTAQYAQMQETLNRIEDRVDRIARVTNP